MMSSKPGGRISERDLEAARLTQQSLIPQKLPALEGWDVAAIYQPVIQVGGDIYGWLRMADGRTLFWIVDATGHGASAALLTTLAKLLFHHGSMEHTRPAAIMRAVNNDFRSIFGARSFMTAMCVALDPASGRVDRCWRGSSSVIGGAARRRNGIAPFLRSAARFGRRSRNSRRARSVSIGAMLSSYIQMDYSARSMRTDRGSRRHDWGKCCSLPGAMRLPCSPRSSNRPMR